MARIGLTRHRKFLRLAYRLRSPALALGHLEFMWEAAYEAVIRGNIETIMEAYQ